MDPYTSEFNSVKMWPAKDAIFYGGLTITDKHADKPEVIEAPDQVLRLVLLRLRH